MKTAQPAIIRVARNEANDPATASPNEANIAAPAERNEPNSPQMPAVER